MKTAGMIAMLVVSVTSTALYAVAPSLPIAAVEVTAAVLAGGLAVTRAHHLWPMALSLSMALIAIGAHRIQLAL